MFFAIISALRPKQWVKNLLVFAPLIFSREFLNPHSLKLTSIAFVAFCLAASGVYLMNDIFDKKSDARHPIKKKRAIASGKLSVPLAVLLSLSLVFVSFFISWKTNCILIDILLIYLVLQFSYSSYFKHVAILDLIFIASGFILRVFAGGAVIDVEVSNWLLAITFLLALLLATGKRLRELETQGSKSRKVLENYSAQFLEATIKVLIPTILVSYLFYSFQASGSSNFIFTVPIVTYGLLRYLLLIHTKSANENPTDLIFEDKALLSSVILWIAAVIGILSFA